MYTPEIRDFIAQHPNIIKTVVSMIKAVGPYGSMKQEQGLTVTLVQEGLLRPAYKVSLEDGHSFFIKAQDYPFPNTQGGVNEMKAYQDALGRLQDIPWVEIIKYHLAYKDHKKSYVVSEWYDNLATDLGDYRLELLGKIRGDVDRKEHWQNELAGIDRKILKLAGMLPDHHDVLVHNMGYDKQTKKIVLFDLNFNQERFRKDAD